MGVLAGVCSIGAASLFLARLLRRSSALMPLVAVAAAMLLFMAAGCAGVLQAAGWAWYALCAAALAWVLIRERRNALRLVSPGLVFFLAAGVFFVLLYAATRPMLTAWDEFTFWGTAAKVTSENHELYTTATSGLIARSYPPGLVVYAYMMQFFGGFSEPGFIAAFAVLPLAGFAAAGGLWAKNRAAAALFFGAMFLLPLLFEAAQGDGRMSQAYLVCMADMPMGVMFGGALCLYHAGGDKGARLMLPFAAVLAALCSVKDMGLALALLALLAAAGDMLLCERRKTAFHRLRGARAGLLSAAVCLAAVAGAYALWAAHLWLAGGIDRFNLGGAGAGMSQAGMLLAGVKALFGIGRSEQFSDVLRMMTEAFFTRPVSLIGSCAAVLALILAVSALAFALSPTRRARARAAVFTLLMCAGFAAFYIFNIFTYSFIFSWREYRELKDYERYISPYLMGWLMCAMTMLSGAATNAKATFHRLRAARLAAACAALAIVLCVGARVNTEANFLRVSPSLYGEREKRRAVAQEAARAGMKKEDVVYIISQYDDGTRFYIYGFELPALRVPLYAGPLVGGDGVPVTDTLGRAVYGGNVAVTLCPRKEEYAEYEVPCTRGQLSAYLRQAGCTHVLIDTPDYYVLEELAPMFSDGLAGWADDFTSVGSRYYRVEWQEDGGCLLVPQKGEGAA